MSMWKLWKQAGCGRYTVKGDLKNADCVIGFAFGGVREGTGVRPGQSNDNLARYALKHCPTLPKILQGEIADAFLALAAGCALLRVDRHRRPDRYLDTREVAEQAVLLMHAHGWRTAVILAQGHHVPRADAVCRKLGIRTVVPPGLERVPFCPHSVQRWTRNARAWLRRETLALLYYRWAGWI
jgi:uncharacterized SAM-binding protein YcdF (DUF218 family)